MVLIFVNISKFPRPGAATGRFPANILRDFHGAYLKALTMIKNYVYEAGLVCQPQPVSSKIFEKSIRSAVTSVTRRLSARLEDAFILSRLLAGLFLGSETRNENRVAEYIWRKIRAKLAALFPTGETGY